MYFPIFFKCSIQFFLSVHDDRAIPRDGLFYRLAGYQKKPERSIPRGDAYFIAILKKNKVPRTKEMTAYLKITFAVYNIGKSGITHFDGMSK